ncbi:hypothetical protein SDC9_155832 [bioreactor metagenome]|uniref:Uncharacterized protein n=1 Tax=bioreactor metagenome TaxID=1076179 RepID=A0A645F546_9ZZZZ
MEGFTVRAEIRMGSDSCPYASIACTDSSLAPQELMVTVATGPSAMVFPSRLQTILLMPFGDSALQESA